MRGSHSFPAEVFAGGNGDGANRRPTFLLDQPQIEYYKIEKLFRRLDDATSVYQRLACDRPSDGPTGYCGNDGVRPRLCSRVKNLTRFRAIYKSPFISFCPPLLPLPILFPNTPPPVLQVEKRPQGKLERQAQHALSIGYCDTLRKGKRFPLVTLDAVHAS